MPVVKMTEMYDLSTTRDKIGLIGIHTPNSDIVAKRWNGFFMNYKFFRVKSCNVRMACASVLPSDPQGIGITADPTIIAPQDIMNPILYRAVSNEAFNYIIGKIYDSSAESRSVKFKSDILPNASVAGTENIYYTILGDSGWKKAMPQSGLAMRGLRPIVYDVVNTYGNTFLDSNRLEISDMNSHAYSDPNSSSAISAVSTDGQSLRGSARPFPRLPCTLPSSGTDAANPTLTPSVIPKTYCAVIVLPPAKLKEFYFRLIVDWYIEFMEPVPLTEKINATQLAGVGSLVYARSYTFSSAKDLNDVSDDVKEESTLDVVDANVNLIMEH